MGKLVGEYLRDIAPLTSAQIVGALRNQMILKDEGNHRRIGELLVDAGHITPAHLGEALERQSKARQTGGGHAFSNSSLDMAIHSNNDPPGLGV